MDEADGRGSGAPHAGSFSPRRLPPNPVWTGPPAGEVSDEPEPTRALPVADVPGRHDQRQAPPAGAPGPRAAARAGRPGHPGRPALPGSPRPQAGLDSGSGRRDGLRRRALLGLGLFGVLLAVIVVLWVLDGQANEGTVARNVVLLDRDIGGMDREEVVAAVAALADRYRSADVEVKAPDGGFRAGAAELGISVAPRRHRRRGPRRGPRGLRRGPHLGLGHRVLRVPQGPRRGRRRRERGTSDRRRA